MKEESDSSDMIDLGKTTEYKPKKCYPSFWVRGIKLPDLPANAEGEATIKFKKVMQRWGEREMDNEAEFEIHSIKFGDIMEASEGEEEGEGDTIRSGSKAIADSISEGVLKRKSKQTEDSEE